MHICFVIAMKSEAAPITDCMQGVQENTLCGRAVYGGRLCDEETHVIVCGVGKVNAACGAQIAADLLGADAIINIGFAGALNNSMEVGGIYAIEYACQYDFDLVQLNGTPMGTLNEFEDRWLPLAVAGGYQRKKLATGDRFNDDAGDFKMLTEDFRADIRDMEGGAIAQACIHAGKPLYSFKAISDIAGSGSTTEQYLGNIKKCTENIRAHAEDIFRRVKQDAMRHAGTEAL